MDINTDENDFCDAMEQNKYIVENLKRSSVCSHLIQSDMNFTVISNYKGQIVYYNEAFEEMAQAEGDMTGKSFGEIISCSEKLRDENECGRNDTCSFCPWFNSVNNVFSEEKNIYEGIIRKNEHESIEVLIESFSLEFNGEQFVLSSIKDISAEKQKGLLERIFFHDVGNILTVINGYTSILESNPDRIELISKISMANKRLKEEIYYQKQVNLAETNSLIPLKKEADISMLAKEVGEMSRQFSGAKYLTIKLEIEHDVTLWTDATILRRVLLNMMKNAVEASSPEETVTFSLKVDGDVVRISVTNSCFIEKEIQSQIFKRSFSTKAANRGLGTYCIKIFTEKYLKGKVFFTSTREEGTIFTIYLNTTSNRLF